MRTITTAILRNALKFMMISSVVSGSSGALARPDGHFTFENFSDVREVIEERIKIYGADRVLIALDIDNTVMSMENDFGSEHWSIWQSKLITEGRFDVGAVARTIPTMLNVQSQITALSPMHAIERRIPIDLKQFGKQGVRMLALTSRGLSFHDATLREFRRNEFPFSTFAPGPKGGFPGGSYMPLDLQYPELSGLTHREVKDLSLKSVEPALYRDGVFMTTGQHKGAMLRTLLFKLRAQFDAIIFIDDRLKHSQGMQAEFEKRREAVTTIQYSHNGKAIEQWQESDKFEAKQDWCDFSKALNAVGSHSDRASLILCQ